MSPANSLKTWLRDALPMRHQVPMKYLVNSLAGRVESEMRLLDRVLRPGELAVDVGGNRGVYAYRLWKLGAEVQVFEPNPSCASVLTAWADGKPRVHVHSVGLSDTPGSASLLIPVDEAGVEHDASASLEQHDFGHSREQSVPLRTLDSYGFNSAAFIKIDVEGHETKVIRGAQETLRTARPALLIEIEQRHIQRPIYDVFDEVCGLGYRGFYLSRQELRPLASFDVQRDQDTANLTGGAAAYINNFLFLHTSRIAAGAYPRLPLPPAP